MIRRIIEDHSHILGTNSQVIPGVHLFPRENDKTMANLFIIIQKASDDPKLKGKIKKLHLVRLTDDADMIPALNKNAVAIDPPTNYPRGGYGSMQ